MSRLPYGGGMSVREKLQDHLGYPPKGLRAPRAAAYLDMSPSKFLALVGEGIIPKPVNVGGVKIWDRDDLDGVVESAKDKREIALETTQKIVL